MTGSTLYDSIARIARHESKARLTAGIGIVTESFGADDSAKDHCITVKMRDSGMVLPRLPIAVGALGLAALPSPDDMVVVLFTEGDINGGIVIGRIYHPGTQPPVHGEKEIILHLPPDKDEPDFSVSIKMDPPSLKISIPEKEPEMQITCLKESIEMTVKEMNLKLLKDGRAEIAAGGSVITLKKDGDILISAKGNIVMDAKEISLSGESKVTIKASSVEIN